MSRGIDRRVRCFLAALMLMTGLMGQAGHAWAHAGGESQRAWAEALQAEQAWLADAASEPGVQIFVAGRGHSHDDGSEHLHGGLAADHSHSMVFLMPPGTVQDIAGMPAASSWATQGRIPITPSDSPDRPPRGA